MPIVPEALYKASGFFLVGDGGLGARAPYSSYSGDVKQHGES